MTDPSPLSFGGEFDHADDAQNAPSKGCSYKNHENNKILRQKLRGVNWLIGAL